MNKKEVIQIINCNVNWINKSFLYFLHEENIFSEKSFWEFYEAVRFLGIDNYDRELSRDLTAQLIRIYEHFLFLISCHFNQKDNYNIKNLPENYNDYYDRLRTIITAYILGKPINDKEEEKLNKYLKNML